MLCDIIFSMLCAADARAQQLQEAAQALQRKAERSAARQVEWADGPLVQAMKAGDALLIDEINLAEDAVLERLNRYAGGYCFQGGLQL